MPLVLAVEPQAPAWAQHTVRFLQTGELPEEQEEVEKVAHRSTMYQFVDDVLYSKRPNDVKLKCIPREELSAFWERGSPDLPACGLRRGLKGAQHGPTSSTQDPRPSRRAKPRGADDAELPQARPHQAGSRGGGEIKTGYLTRCP